MQLNYKGNNVLYCIILVQKFRVFINNLLDKEYNRFPTFP